MTARRWLVVVVFAVSATATIRGGCLNSGKAPDEKLAAHFEAICKIAHDNVDTPAPGVRVLGRYLGAHLDDMLGEVGGTVAAIENIADDREHDARARLARDRIHAPLLACTEDLTHFVEAVEADPEAAALVERHVDRLARTLEIILSSEDLLVLPRSTVENLRRVLVKSR